MQIVQAGGAGGWVVCLPQRSDCCQAIEPEMSPKVQGRTWDLPRRRLNSACRQKRENVTRVSQVLVW